MDTILILDFGGQYNQLIARRVREKNVYCEVHPYTLSMDKIRELSPKGIIFTGGPKSVYYQDAPRCSLEIFELGIPILGICYGSQLLAYSLGGKVLPSEEGSAREYGKTITCFDTRSKLFMGIPDHGISWMSHGDYIFEMPEGFQSIAYSDNCPNAAIVDEQRNFYGVQFHPEVDHTEYGAKIIQNFLFQICEVKAQWTIGNYYQETVTTLKSIIGNQGRVLLALSGGVDSSVLAALLAEAIGSRLTCVFVDHGFMRKNEAQEIENVFQRWPINFIRIDAEKRFLEKIKGIVDPQEKRRIIGAEFGYVFLEEAERFHITQNDFLAQGTIYPDVIESGEGDADIIKNHHNRLLPAEVVSRFKSVLEPLSLLFKDEVRQLGRELGLPENIIMRQPFPGPGLAIRIIGEVTKEKADILREADYIFRQEILNSGWDTELSQYFTVLTDTHSVGVMGDGRTYEYVLALRAVNTKDFMTADWARIPYELLERVSVRIINEVPHINRVCYDITSKPPATVEWE